MFDPDSSPTPFDTAASRPRPAEVRATLVATTPRAASDLGNAERFVARHGSDLLFCHDWRSWLVWDGERWRPDRRGEVQERAIDTVRAIDAEVRAARGVARKGLVVHAASSQRADRIAAMIRLAQSALPVIPAELDADPWLLNTPSGTLDLRTGASHSHRRNDRITRSTSVGYDAVATCPRWEAFLADAVGGDADLVAYLGRAAGYAASGSTRERAIVVLHGPTATGKSTILEVLRAALGDYAAVTPISTLLGGQHGSGIPSDVAALAGARLVIASEADDSGAWDSAKLKLLTGGDTLTARRLYGQYFTFSPTHTLFLSTNRLPTMLRPDEALVERLHLVPFPAPEPARRRDHGLRELLLAELPGILAWIVRGALAWQREGLRPPAAMAAARGRYRDESDPVGPWLYERADLRDRRAETRVRDAYDDYLAWCARADEAPAGERAFGARLMDGGLTRRRATHGERRWVGLRLRGDEGDASDGSSPVSASTPPAGIRRQSGTAVTSVTPVTGVAPRSAA